jgi:hypothetical protein
MRQIWLIGVITFASATFSCSEDKKEKEDPAPQPTQNTSNLGNGGNTVVDTTPAGPAMTKSQCNGQSKAWVAVVNGGQSPATCGDPLASWGCCKSQIVARFAGQGAEIGNRIDSAVGEGYQLYNCSQANERNFKLHFAKFPAAGRTEYKAITIDAFAYQPTGQVENCPQIPNVNFPEGPIVNGSGSPSPIGSGTGSGIGTGTGSGTVGAVTFSQANGIIKTNCSQSGCHGKTGASSTIFEDNEVNVKAKAATIRDRIDRTDNLMMPKTGGSLRIQDKDTLKGYFTGQGL